MVPAFTEIWKAGNSQSCQREEAPLQIKPWISTCYEKTVKTDFNSLYRENLEFVNPHNTLSVRKCYRAEKVHLQSREQGHMQSQQRHVEWLQQMQKWRGNNCIQGTSVITVSVRSFVDLATKFPFCCKFFSLGVLRRGLLLVHLIIQWTAVKFLFGLKFPWNSR